MSLLSGILSNPPQTPKEDCYLRSSDGTAEMDPGGGSSFRVRLDR